MLTTGKGLEQWIGMVVFPRDTELPCFSILPLSFEVALFVNTSVCGIVVLKSLHGGYFIGLWYVARALQRMGSWVGIPGLQCHHVVESGEGLPTN